MSDFEKLTKGSQDLDDELVQFTDDLLDGQINLENAEAYLSEDQELRKLQEMALQMRRTFGAGEPSPAMSSRMKMQLVTELRKMQAQDKEKPERVWTRALSMFPRGNRRGGQIPLRSLGMIAAVFVLVFVVMFFSTDLGSQIRGTVIGIPDRIVEVTPLFGLNIRVSVDSSGQEADNDSWYSAISADGRYIAFVSASDNLVENDTNGVRDIFVHDRISGETERVSLGAGNQEGDGDSLNPAISADGRFVVFESQAGNLVNGDGNGARDIFVRDRQTGATEIVSTINGQTGNGDSRYPTVSGDGRYVAFFSLATNLAAGDNNGVGDVFLYDRQSGAVELASIATGGQMGDGESRNPALSGDGRYVAFDSVASNLVANDTNSASDIFLYDHQSGSLQRVSVNANNEEGDGHSYNPDVSEDGAFVTFHSQAENLWDGDSNNEADVFVYSRSADNQVQMERVSVAVEGGQANASSGYAAISADGRYVTFSSFASNLAGGEIYGDILDIYLYDREVGETERISADELDQEPDGASVNPDISADGRFVSFDSTAGNLVGDDTNGRVDVFIRDRVPPVDMVLNYTTGMPGSFFTVTGSHFTPDSNVSLVINGVALGNVTSDATGDFAVVLATDAADPGGYLLWALAETGEAGVGFVLDPGAAVRPKESDAPLFNVPAGIAYTQFYYLPVIIGK